MKLGISLEEILSVVCQALNQNILSLEEVIKLRVLEPELLTIDQTEQLCSTLRSFFNGSFSRAYSYFLTGGRFFLSQGDHVFDYKDVQMKVHRRIQNLLLATAEDKEILSYYRKNKDLAMILIDTKNKFKKRFRKKEKK